MIVQFGSHGWGTTEEINPPETNIECKTCGEKMVLKSVIGLIHSGTHKFISECPNCKSKREFCDYELWQKCRREGMKVHNKK